MKRADILVVGGSAAGLTAAITARRHYPEKNVLIIRKERKEPPYRFYPDKNYLPVDAFLDKPVPPEVLTRKVREMLGIHRDDDNAVPTSRKAHHIRDAREHRPPVYRHRTGGSDY